MVKNLLSRHYEAHKKEYDHAAIDVLASGWYVTGNQLSAFDANVNHFFHRYGKQFFQEYGKEFFLTYGKQNFQG